MASVADLGAIVGALDGLLNLSLWKNVKSLILLTNFLGSTFRPGR